MRSFIIYIYTYTIYIYIYTIYIYIHTIYIYIYISQQVSYNLVYNYKEIAGFRALTEVNSANSVSFRGIVTAMSSFPLHLGRQKNLSKRS